MLRRVPVVARLIAWLTMVSTWRDECVLAHAESVAAGNLCASTVAKPARPAIMVTFKGSLCVRVNPYGVHTHENETSSSFLPES